MSKTVTIIAITSVCLIAAALVVWRLGAGPNAGLVPIADPNDLLFSDQEEPGAVWIEISMVLLLLGLAGGIATIRYWFRSRKDLEGFAGRGTGIISR